MGSLALTAWFFKSVCVWMPLLTSASTYQLPVQRREKEQSAVEKLRERKVGRKERKGRKKERKEGRHAYRGADREEGHEKEKEREQERERKREAPSKEHQERR